MDYSDYLDVEILAERKGILPSQYLRQRENARLRGQKMAESHPGYRTDKSREWRESHPDYYKDYYKRHKEERAETARRYYLAHREERIAYAKRYKKTIANGKA